MTYSFGNKIKELRKEEKLTQEELVEKLNNKFELNINKGMISKWESNKVEPRLNVTRALSQFFDVSLDYLLGLDDLENTENEKTTHLIPLIGTICAGDGVFAEENIEEYITYPFTNKKQPDYALRVKGDSMIDAGIQDGDIVFMKRNSWAEYNGQIVAAIINDQQDGTLKRIRWNENDPQIILEPQNKNYETIYAYPNEIRICGTYVGHFRYDF